jgi:hypothetical protein
MASLYAPLFISGARGADGLPIASGTAHFYVRGSTSEYLTVFADAEETTPITGPVQLDAAGRADVYVSAPSDLIINDATGALVREPFDATGVASGLVEVNSANWTQDNLADVLEQIAGNTWGKNGTYKESYSTGIAERMVHDVLASSISPFDFGAIGNGSADDTVPLQRAIARALAAKVPLLLGSGSFKITAGLTVNGALSIRGNGSGQSKIVATSESFDGITITVPNGNLSDTFEFRDFAVLLPYTSAYGNKAINLAAGSGASFENLALSGGGGVDCAGGYAAVENCRITVNGSSSYPSIGINQPKFARNCVIDCNPTAGTVAHSCGIVMNGVEQVAIECSVQGADKGFSVSAAQEKITVIGCRAFHCNTSFEFGPGVVAIGCSSISPATRDTALIAGANSFVDIGNSWTVGVPATTSVANALAGVAVSTGTATIASAVAMLFSGGVKKIAMAVSAIHANAGGSGAVEITLSGIAAMTDGICTVIVTPLLTSGSASNRVTSLEAHTSGANVFGFTLDPTATQDGQLFNAYVEVTGA